MLTLGIDTATRTGGVALADDGKVIASRACPLRLTHSESLLPVVVELFEESGVSLSRVEAVAVAAGPGSFTGLRVGLAAAKGLAVGKNLPVVGVPTMEALALPFRGEDLPVWVLLPSRRDHVFAGLFRWAEGDGGWAVERLRPEENRRVEEFLSELEEPVFLSGPGLPGVEDMTAAFGDAAADTHRVVVRKSATLWVWRWMWRVLMCGWPGRGNVVFQALLRFLTPLLVRCRFGTCYRAEIWLEPRR